MDIFLYNGLYLYIVLAGSKPGETVYFCTHIHMVFSSVMPGATQKVYIFLYLYLYNVLSILPGAVTVLCREPASCKLPN